MALPIFVKEREIKFSVVARSGSQFCGQLDAATRKDDIICGTYFFWGEDYPRLNQIPDLSDPTTHAI